MAPAGKQFHTLGIAAICWAIWKTRNTVCFEGKSVTNPVTFAHELLGRFLENDKEALVAGVNTMLEIAVKLMSKKTAKKGQYLLKDDKGDSQGDREGLF